MSKNPKIPTLLNPQTSKTPSQAQASSNPVEEARRRLLALEDALNKIVIGREDAVRALMLALIARQHVVMIGPPGTAKSYLALSLAKLLQARYYAYLMTRFTGHDEIFGSIDILAFTQRGELKRKWSNIIEAEIVFLDEIFKAGSPILNSLLSLMQERQVYDSTTGQSIQAKLWTLVAASNEIPAEDELQAVYDRFAVKTFIDYIDDDEKILAALVARWQSATAATPVASMQDVKTLHEYAIQLLSRGRIREMGELIKIYYINMVPLARSLRSKGVVVSDRMLVEKAAMLWAAYIALYGATPENLTNAALDIVQYLARTPQELRDIKKVVEDALGEVAELAKKLEKAKKLLAAKQRDAALKILLEVATYDVARLQPWLKLRAEALIKTAQDYIRQLEEP